MALAQPLRLARALAVFVSVLATASARPGGVGPDGNEAEFLKKRLPSKDSDALPSKDSDETSATAKKYLRTSDARGNVKGVEVRPLRAHGDEEGTDTLGVDRETDTLHTCADTADRRVVSVADLHGDFAAMVQLLGRLGLVRAGVTTSTSTWKDLWTGGNATFIQLGDINDRGDHGRWMWTFLWALQDSVWRDRQAGRTCGNVVLLLGNHEAWRLLGQGPRPTRVDMCSYTVLRDAPALAECVLDPYSKDKACRAGGSGSAWECYQRAWAGPASTGAKPGYMYRQVLERLKVGRMKLAHKEGTSLFVHAGWTLGTFERLRLARPSLAHSVDGDAYVEELNSLAVEVLEGSRSPSRGLAFVLDAAGDGHGNPSKDGPTWTRLYSGAPTDRVCVEAHKVLKLLGVSRMVKGHDPMKSGIAKARCRGKVLYTDTLMSLGFTMDRQTSNNHLMALETTTKGTDVWFVYPMRQGGQQRQRVEEKPRALVRELDGADYVCCSIALAYDGADIMEYPAVWATAHGIVAFSGQVRATGLETDDFVQQLFYRDRCRRGAQLAVILGADDASAGLSAECDHNTQKVSDIVPEAEPQARVLNLDDEDYVCCSITLEYDGVGTEDYPAVWVLAHGFGAFLEKAGATDFGAETRVQQLFYTDRCQLKAENEVNLGAEAGSGKLSTECNNNSPKDFEIWPDGDEDFEIWPDGDDY